MKKLFLLILSIGLICSCGGNGDKSGSNSTDTGIKKGLIEKQLTHDGVEREYLLYVPDSYTGEEALPLLFVFHGLGGNMNQIYQGTEFNLLADQHNFIAVFPQGLPLQSNGLNAWNLADIGTDDVGFTSYLMDEIATEYIIDIDRTYSTGMSNGGFFSFKLACQLNYRIAAIAPVSSVMTNNELENCTPQKPTPVITIHGTLDLVVPYSSVQPTLDYWIEYNQTETTPEITALPDIDPNDRSTVEEYIYQSGTNGVVVKHLKVINGSHSWPGSSGNMDISASEEIWEFVSKYSNDGLIE